MDEIVNEPAAIPEPETPKAQTWAQFLETEKAVRVIYLIFGFIAIAMVMTFLQTRTDAICCGDWERICSVGTITRFGVAGILLDPPYGTTTELYAEDSMSVAGDVLRWCAENGGNSALRIALCGHVPSHLPPHPSAPLPAVRTNQHLTTIE